MDISSLYNMHPAQRWRSPGVVSVPKNWMGREFFNSRSVEKWMETLEWNRDLRENLLPQILKRWVGKHLIDSDQAQHLKDMFLSPDKENWLVAITIMKSIAKKKKRR